ncbi:hypothetical protein [Variovorax sp. W6]|uniref:hypothetical protein n=1 Tax=Variovorax sp. W6 TaxID=3093895 RepID=UPI003D801A39
MTTFAVTAVRWADDNITHVLMGEVVKSGTVFKAEPVERPVIDAVDRLRRGDTVVLSFPGALPGPGLRVVVAPNGDEGIETLPFELPNKTLRDLPTF